MGKNAVAGLGQTHVFFNIAVKGTFECLNWFGTNSIQTHIVQDYSLTVLHCQCFGGLCSICYTDMVVHSIMDIFDSQPVAVKGVVYRVNNAFLASARFTNKSLE